MSNSKEQFVFTAIVRQLQQNSYRLLLDTFNDFIEVSHQLVASKFDEDLCNVHSKPCILMDTGDVMNLL